MMFLQQLGNKNIIKDNNKNSIHLLWQCVPQLALASSVDVMNNMLCHTAVVSYMEPVIT